MNTGLITRSLIHTIKNANPLKLQFYNLPTDRLLEQCIEVPLSEFPSFGILIGGDLV